MCEIEPYNMVYQGFLSHAMFLQSTSNYFVGLAERDACLCEKNMQFSSNRSSLRPRCLLKESSASVLVESQFKS